MTKIKNPKFIVTKIPARPKTFEFCLTARNGVVLIWSDGVLDTAKECLQTIKLIKQYAPIAQIEDLTND